MDEDLERRIGANQARLRQVNEAIERGQWPGDADAVGFICECAHLGCNRVVELTPSEYDRIRAHARRFVVVPGHEHEHHDVETVVETHPNYKVVEKTDEAGVIADATDPRD